MGSMAPVAINKSAGTTICGFRQELGPFPRHQCSCEGAASAFYSATISGPHIFLLQPLLSLRGEEAEGLKTPGSQAGQSR